MIILDDDDDEDHDDDDADDDDEDDDDGDDAVDDDYVDYLMMTVDTWRWMRMLVVLTDGHASSNTVPAPRPFQPDDWVQTRPGPLLGDDPSGVRGDRGTSGAALQGVWPCTANLAASHLCAQGL